MPSRLDATEHPVIACYRGLDSADAVGLGALMAKALREPLVLASAYRYDPVSLSAQALPAPDNERRATAAATALRRARQFAGPGVEVRDAVVPGARIIDALVELAGDCAASMLVLGRDTRGHVTRSLIPRAPCPVAVSPLSVPLPRVSLPRRIGIAFDGSPTAACALVAARHLALTTGAQLVVLAAAATEAHAAAWLHIARQSLETSNVQYTTSALLGKPAARLSEASGELDLLVCGSRGRGRPLATILGSVSTQLVTHAQCPVLVVPPTAARRDGHPLGIAPSAANL
ncbi:MAG: hypothetical protein QOI64_989 [Solirubrobacteraceae bacterium]|jgi:nucleotide-binding universal stress UspA family protein|nr:hypothetical protein [Solirubrobacteraceae bacterium]